MEEERVPPWGGARLPCRVGALQCKRPFEQANGQDKACALGPFRAPVTPTTPYTVSSVLAYEPAGRLLGLQAADILQDGEALD